MFHIVDQAMIFETVRVMEKLGNPLQAATLFSDFGGAVLCWRCGSGVRQCAPARGQITATCQYNFVFYCDSDALLQRWWASWTHDTDVLASEQTHHVASLTHLSFAIKQRRTMRGEHDCPGPGSIIILLICHATI